MHLARRYEVSQATIREALANLEHAGFVRRFSSHGNVCYQKLSLDELREVLGLRVLLEGLAAMEAARRMTDPEFLELEGRVETNI